MDDLFKKLNVLIKSSLNDLTGDEPSRRSSQPKRLGKDIDRELVALRQRIDDAYAYEAELKTRIITLEDEVGRLDREADAALEQRREEQARYVVGQMQRSQQRLTMAQADLREHQLVTQELVQRVNTLDSYVAEVRRVQQDAAPETVATTGGLADVLRSAREKILREAPETTVQYDEPLEEDVPDRQTVDDDLEQRRQRLSKP